MLVFFRMRPLRPGGGRKNKKPRIPKNGGGATRRPPGGGGIGRRLWLTYMQRATRHKPRVKKNLRRARVHARVGAHAYRRAILYLRHLRALAHPRPGPEPWPAPARLLLSVPECVNLRPRKPQHV